MLLSFLRLSLSSAPVPFTTEGVAVPEVYISADESSNELNSYLLFATDLFRNANHHVIIVGMLTLIVTSGKLNPCGSKHYVRTDSIDPLKFWSDWKRWFHLVFVHSFAARQLLVFQAVYQWHNMECVGILCHSKKK